VSRIGGTTAAPRWRRAGFVLRAAVAAGLLAFVVKGFGGLERLGQGLAGIPVLALVGAVAANTADRLLMAWKWDLLLRAWTPGLPLLRATRIYCASMVWGMFLPATVGADGIRAMSAVRGGLPANRVLASILVERGLGVLGSLLLGLAGILAVSSIGEYPPELVPVWWLGVLFLAAAAIALAASFSERIYVLLHDGLLRHLRETALGGRLRSLHQSYREYRQRRSLLLAFLGLSILEQLVPAAAVGSLLWGLAVPIPPLYLVGAVAIAFLIARIPVSLGGLGILEGSLAVLLVFGGVPEGKALTVTLAARLAEVGSWLPWWIGHLLERRRPSKVSSCESG